MATNEEEQGQPVQIGQIAANLPALRGRRTADEISVEASVAMRSDDDPEIGFVHSVFASVGLPRRRLPIEQREFIRTCGRASMLIEAGQMLNEQGEWVKQGVPYGTKPRLFMHYLCTAAVQRQSRRVEVGESLSHFMRLLGETRVTGGANGNVTAYREQILALSASHITLGLPRREGPSENVKWDPLSRFALWANGGSTSWPEYVELGEGFFASVLDHAVPLDIRALRALRASALQWDVYIWAASRLHRIGPRPEFIRFAALAKQFSDYDDLKNFKREFKSALRRVLEFYPEARIEMPGGGILLRQSPPPIRKVSIMVTKSA